ncbi:MAG: Bifunctional deaminase-reductase domain protein [Candidatus Uhrbacteria bacterium GW2011_GWA2_53_10]|uniref:Bifunctional deaminase-reductase domain protein n=1 Tax=Candidatus Uhrbacteria bacterium GW2011_GWA2_53_10 TaxID=1618980 RepID=A0A0G2AJR9_9BACT|nr:MAG: Bifunctional deaminase-reductase domain protein [Candidatus Uhrbacteria bacterium GW2011_GWA2_53_10]
MRIILIAAVTADGKIAQKENQSSLTWTSKEDTKFFVSKTKEIGTVIMGRKTFATIGKPLKDRRVIVLTRTPPKPPLIKGGDQGVSPPFQVTAFGPAMAGSNGGRGAGGGTVEFTDEDPKALLERLEQEGVKAVAVAGGAQIYSTFLREGLVDELYLTVEPYLFGDGTPLVEGCDPIEMELVDSTRLGDNAVLMHYQVHK